MSRLRVSLRCGFMKCKCWMLGGRREQKIRSVDCAGFSISRGVVIVVFASLRLAYCGLESWCHLARIPYTNEVCGLKCNVLRVNRRNS